MNPGRRVADGDLFTQGQHARAHHSIRGKAQRYRARKPGAASGISGAGQIDGAGLAEGSCRITVAGAEIEYQLLHILAAEVGALKNKLPMRDFRNLCLPQLGGPARLRAA